MTRAGLRLEAVETTTGKAWAVRGGSFVGEGPSLQHAEPEAGGGEATADSEGEAEDETDSPSLQDKSVIESVGSSFNHAEIVRLTVNATQIVLFAATLALPRVGFPKMAYGLAWACVAMSVALFHEAYLALRRRSPNVELMMAIAVVGALVQGQRGRDIAEI